MNKKNSEVRETQLRREAMESVVVKVKDGGMEVEKERTWARANR